MKVLLLLVGTILCSSTMSFGQNSSESRNEYLAQNKQMDSLIAKWNTNSEPGVAIAIIKDKKVIYKKCLGLANLEYNTPITNTSVFNMALVARQFTAFAILLLEKQGKLKLDDNVRTYLPDVPSFGKTITLRHLANHSSGLRDYLSLKAMQGWQHRDVIGMKDVLQVIGKQKKLNFNPGEEYSSSSTNYVLLAEVVAKVSNMSFSEFCEKYIFSPLHMDNSIVYDDSFKIIKNQAGSYFLNSKGYNKIVVNNEVVGDGNIFTTIDDLILWTLNFSNPKVGDSTIINKMNTPFVLNGGDTTSVGLGQNIGQYKGVPEVSQHGIQGGFKAKLTRFPSESLAIIVLSNSYQTNTYKPIQEVVEIYLKDKLSPSPLMEPNSIETPDTSAKKQFTKDQICGIYQHESGKKGVEMNIYQKDSLLNVSLDFINCHFSIGNSVGNRYEILENPPVKFKFTSSENKQAQTLTKYENGRVSVWKRIKKVDLSQSNLNDYTGEFYSEELSTTYRFEIKEGRLTLIHNRLPAYTFKQTGLNNFQGSVSLLNQLEFVRDSNDKVTSIKIRNVYFMKK